MELYSRTFTNDITPPNQENSIYFSRPKKLGTPLYIFAIGICCIPSISVFTMFKIVTVLGCN